MSFFGQVVETPLPYDDIQDVRQRLTEVSPNLTRYGDVEQANFFAQAETLAKVRIYQILRVVEWVALIRFLFGMWHY